MFLILKLFTNFCKKKLILNNNIFTYNDLSRHRMSWNLYLLVEPVDDKFLFLKKMKRTILKSRYYTKNIKVSTILIARWVEICFQLKYRQSNWVSNECFISELTSLVIHRSSMFWKRFQHCWLNPTTRHVLVEHCKSLCLFYYKIEKMCKG